MKKIIKSKKLENLEVLTDTGFVKIEQIHTTVKFEIWKINIQKLNSNKVELKCADNHIVFDENMNEIFVKNLVIGSKIFTDEGLGCVLDIIKTNEFEEMYDLELGDNSNHRYYTNDILSHNTSSARVLSKEYPTKYINISSNRGIEVVRDTIEKFASTKSIEVGKSDEIKVVILDEMDGGTDTLFKALRATMEKFSNTTRFIGTCNYLNKIPEPIQSRFSVINFNPQNKKEEEELLNKYIKRVKIVTTKLGISWQSEDLIKDFVLRNFPDLRKIFSIIQDIKNSNIEVITSEEITKKQYQFLDLYNAIISKTNPQDLYKLIISNFSGKSPDIFSDLAREFPQWMFDNYPNKESKLPLLIHSIADWDYKRSFHIDENLGLLACAFECNKIINS